MPRKGNVPKRDVLPDPIYNSKLVTIFIIGMMVSGKKGTAQSLLFGDFDFIAEQSGKNPNEVFEQALNNIMPVLEVKAKRIGGQNYQVPMEVKPERKIALGLRWLVSYARLRNEKTMSEKLAKEILDASNNLGGACKKRDEVHRQAEANKAFAHYRV